MANLGGQCLSPWVLPFWVPLCQPKPKHLLLEALFSPICLAAIFRSIAGVGVGREGRQSVMSPGPGQPQKLLANSSLFFLFFSLPFPATIKPPDVTCIPKVRSIQMIIHPTSTPIRAGDGHQLTLEDIFPDLFYRLELQVNHTYQMVNIYVSLVHPSLGTHFSVNQICMASSRKEMFYIN